MIPLHSQKCGQVQLETPLDPLVDYLSDYPRWVTLAFAPLKVAKLDFDHYRVGLPTMGALGFSLTPEIEIEFFAQDTCNRGMRGYQPLQVQGYAIDLTGTFLLDPHPPQVHIRWQVDLAVTLWTPNFLDFLPHSIVKATGDQVLIAVSSLIGDRFLEQLLSAYRAPSS